MVPQSGDLSLLDVICVVIYYIYSCHGGVSVQTFFTMSPKKVQDLMSSLTGSARRAVSESWN